MKMKRFLMLMMSVVAVVILFGVSSDALALPVVNDFDGQVTRMSTQMTRAMGGVPDVQFGFDVDTGYGSKPNISNLSFDINDASFQQSGRIKVKVKDSAMKDSLVITGRLMGDQSGKSKPMSFKITFEDWTGTAFSAEDFLAGNLDPADFSKAIWSVNMGKGKKLQGNITSLPSSLMASVFRGQDDVLNGDGHLGDFDQHRDGEHHDGEHHSDDGNHTPGTAPVPEPTTLILIGAGLTAMVLRNRRPRN